MAGYESNLQARIMLALSESGCLVWRQNTGVLPDRRGIPIRFGLCRGSADIIGIAPDGLFLAVEVKTPTGRVSKEQIAFIAAVRRAGGRAGIARSEAEAVEIACGGRPDV